MQIFQHKSRVLPDAADWIWGLSPQNHGKAPIYLYNSRKNCHSWLLGFARVEIWARMLAWVAKIRSALMIARTEILARFVEIRSALVIARAEILVGSVKIGTALVFTRAEVFAVAAFVIFSEIFIALFVFALVPVLLKTLFAMPHIIFHILTGPGTIRAPEIGSVRTFEIGLARSIEIRPWRMITRKMSAVWRGPGLGADRAAIAQSKSNGRRKNKDGKTFPHFYYPRNF